MLEGGADRVVLRVVGLDHHPSGALAAAGAAGELHQQVVGALDGAEVREAEVGVRRQHRRQRHLREVVPLGHHLGADQHLGVAAGEALEHRRRTAGAAHRVAVEHRQRHVREQRRELLLHPLGAGADRLQRLLLARRAAPRHRPPAAAVVAQQRRLAPVVGLRQAAVLAAEVLAAGAAHQQRRVAAPVAQQDRLLAGGESTAQLVDQPLRELHLAGTPPAAGLAQVDQDALGQPPLPRPRGQRQGPQALPLDVVARFQARRRRHQQGHRAGALRPHQGQVAGVVARRQVLLVGGVLLLVDHHQAEVRHRREECRARSEHHPRLAAADALPLLVAFLAGEVRMEDGEARPEAPFDGPRQGRHQGDLRHQQDARPAALEHLLGGEQVDLGLARAGHPGEQERRVAAGLDGLGERRHRRHLVGAQGERRALPLAAHVAVQRQALDLGEAAQHAELDQAADHGGGAADGVGELLHRRRPAERRQQLDHRLARCRAAGGGALFVEVARRQLDRRHVAHPGAAPAFAAGQAAVGDQPVDDVGELAAGERGSAESTAAGELAVEVGQRQAAGAAQRVDHRRLGVVPRRRHRAGVGEPDAAVAPRRQVGRQHGAHHLPDRRQVVVGDEAGELQQRLVEHRLAIEAGVEGAQGHPLRRLVAEAHHDAHQPPRADLDAHPGARPQAAEQLVRHAVGQGGPQRHRHRHVGHAVHRRLGGARRGGRVGGRHGVQDRRSRLVFRNAVQAEPPCARCRQASEQKAPPPGAGRARLCGTRTPQVSQRTRCSTGAAPAPPGRACWPVDRAARRSRSQQRRQQHPQQQDDDQEGEEAEHPRRRGPPSGSSARRRGAGRRGCPAAGAAGPPSPSPRRPCAPCRRAPPPR